MSHAQNPRASRGGTKLQPDPHTMLELIGLRPVAVDELGSPAVILHDHGIVLIDARADLREVSDWALAATVDFLASQTSDPV